MKLTPLDLRKHQFRKTLRGYDPDEVHGFIAKLAQDWEEVIEEKRRADERVERAEEKLRHYEKVELALQEALETARETGRRAEDMAYQRAKMIVEEAELRAQRIAQDAEQERYNVRQDLVKLNSRQSEIAARLRAFLLSEMEILAQFQGGDPIGFIKLVAATEGAAHDARPTPRLGPAVSETDEAQVPDAPLAPAPVAETAASSDAEAEADAIEPTFGNVAGPERNREKTLPSAPPAVPPYEPVPEAPPVPEPVIAYTPAPAPEPLTASVPEQSPLADAPAAPMPTYRDWLSGLSSRPPEPQPSVESPPSVEREREARPFARSPFRPAVSAEPSAPAEPVPGSDAAQGWSLRSLVAGAHDEDRPSVVASDEERDRIRRILEDLD